MESSVDAGAVNKLKLTRDKQLVITTGWFIDYIKVSKNPIEQNQMVSVFQMHTTINRPGMSKDFDVSSGYPYSAQVIKSRFEEESGGLLYVPPNVHYNKTVSTDLNITVNKSTVKIMTESPVPTAVSAKKFLQTFF